MAVHNTDFITDVDPWENSCAEFEQMFELGSEMASLSSSGASSEKYQLWDNFHIKFNLSMMRYEHSLHFTVNVSAGIEG